MGIGLGESTYIHMVMVRETVEEWVPMLMGTDMNTIVLCCWANSRVRQWLVEDDCKVNLHYLPLHNQAERNFEAWLHWRKKESAVKDCFIKLGQVCGENMYMRRRIFTDVAWKGHVKSLCIRERRRCRTWSCSWRILYLIPCLAHGGSQTV